MPAQPWKYQPRAARELKERLAFTAASQRAASVAAEGKPYSAALAQREMVLSGNNPEARANLLRNRQQTGQKALQFLNPAYERRAQAFDSITGGAEGEALPALPDASGSKEEGGLRSALGGLAGAAGNAAGNALEAGFRHLSRPHGALLGALTGDNPRDSAQQLAEGWRDPDRFSASDVGFARHLPEGSLQRRALGFGLSEAADPANLVIAAKGASIAGKLPRFAGALLEPISKGGFGQRLGGELALSTGAQAGAAALQPLTSQLPEGAQLPVNLAGALLAGGATGAAYSRAPRALDPSNLRSPIDLDARLNPGPPIGGGAEGPVLGPRGAEQPDIEFDDRYTAYDGFRKTTSGTWVKGDYRVEPVLHPSMGDRPMGYVAYYKDQIIGIRRPQSLANVISGANYHAQRGGKPVTDAEIDALLGRPGAQPTGTEAVPRGMLPSASADAADVLSPAERKARRDEINAAEAARLPAEALDETAPSQPGVGLTAEELATARARTSEADRAEDVAHFAESNQRNAEANRRIWSGEDPEQVMAEFNAHQYTTMRSSADEVEDAIAEIRAEYPDPATMPPDVAVDLDSFRSSLDALRGSQREYRPVIDAESRPVADAEFRLPEKAEGAESRTIVDVESRPVSRETVDEVRAEVPQASESGPAPVGPARTPPESQPSPSEALIDHAAGIEEASRLPAEAPPPPSTEPPSPRPPTTGPAAPLHRTPSRLDRAAIASAALRFGTGPDGLAKLKELYGREFGDDVVDSTARRAEADQRARAERTAAAGGGGDEPPRPPDAAEQPDAFDDMDREMGINRNVRPGSEFSGADAELARQAESLIDQSVPNALEKMRESSGARRRAVGTAGGRALRAGKSFFNPSAGMNNRNHTSWSAAQSVRAQVSTVGGVIEAQQLKPLLEALERDPPRYIGPEDFPEEYRGTLNDLGDHPPDHPTDPHYESFSPDVERLMVEYNAARESAIDFSNSSFGTEWGKFTTPGQKLFMSIIEKTNIEDNVDAIIQEVSEYRPSRRSKERTFASLYERWRWETDKAAETGGTVPEFEVDPIKAHEVWMSSLAQDAANSTFRRGVERQAALPQRRAGGEVDMPALTPAQALAREQPQLMAKYNAASAQFREAKRLFRTAERRGQSEEMARWAAEMEQATVVLDDLRPTLQSARLGDLVKNKVTNLYHSRADNAQIERLHQNSFQGVFRVADEFRANVLVMDASVATIQGAVAFFASPVTVTRSLPDAIKHLRDLDSYNNWIKQKQESGVIDRWHSAGGGTLHQQEAEFRPQGIERIPLLGKGVREVNDALWRAVNTFSLEMFEQDSAWLRKQFPDAPQSVLDSASRSVANQLVPRISPGQTGRSQRRAAQERLVMVSPSFAMQPFNAVFGSARGAAALAEQALAKLALHRGADSEAWIKLRPRDQLALRRVSTLAAGTMALSVASAVLSAEANNQSVEDAIAEVMNPQSGRFMSIVLGNEGSIPLGSAYRSVFRLFAAVERDGWQWPERGLSGFLRSKLAPAVRVGFDQVRGEDYFGRPIDEHFGEHTLLSRLFYAGTGAVPIVAQEAALSPLEGRSPREAAVNTVAQLAGANYYGRRPQEEWDRKARAMFGHSANGLERHELQKLKDTYPGLWSDVVITRSEEQQNYEDAKELMRTRQELDDQSLLSGEKTPREWRDQWRTRSAELRAVGEVLFGEREYTVEERDDLLKDDPFRAYIATIALNENEAGNVAWNAVDLWREKLTDDQRAAIDRNTGLGGTAMVRTYRGLESLRKRYLDIPTYRLGWTGLSGPKQADLGRAIDRLYSEIAATRPDAWGARGEERAAALREAYSGFPRDRAAVIAENAGISEQHLIRGVASRIQGTLESNTGREAFIADNPDYLLFWGSRPLNDDQRTRLRQLYRKQWLKLEQTREAA